MLYVSDSSTVGVLLWAEFRFSLSAWGITALTLSDIETEVRGSPQGSVAAFLPFWEI